MTRWLKIAAVVVAGVVVGLFAALVAGLRRVVRPSARQGPSEAEQKIRERYDEQRKQIGQTPSGATVHAMTDKEIEDAANDCTPIPGRPRQ